MPWLKANATTYKIINAVKSSIQVAMYRHGNMTTAPIRIINLGSTFLCAKYPPIGTVKMPKTIMIGRMS